MSKLLAYLIASCRSLLPIAFLLFTVHFLLFAGSAQTTNATLSGVVEDQTGKVVPGAKVTVTNRERGFERTVTSDESGTYVVPLLPPATYTVMAEANGFKRVQFQDIVLNVNDRRSLRIPLEVGDVGGVVEVRGDADMIKTSPEVSTTINRTFVERLPLNGRSFQSLILLTPGVTVAAAGNFDYGQFSVNGQRASANSFTVDGVSANVGINGTASAGGAINAALGGAYPATSAFGGTNNLVSVDALEEFKIQTSSYTAEFGRQPGGQVSLVTRSGTNDFHGSLFEYFRNDALDARDFFNFKPLPKPALRQNQFGGTFSGPLPFLRFGDGGGSLFKSGKDRTFFFFSYEGQRLRLPFNRIVVVPSLRLRDAAPASMKPLLNAFPRPLDSTPELARDGQPTGWTLYNFSVSNPATLDATSIRVDHTINSKVSLFGRFNESPSNTTAFSGGPAGTVNAAATRTLTLGATSTLPSRLNNEFRFNYSRQLGSQGFVPATYGGAVPIDPMMLTSGFGDRGSVSFSYGGQSTNFSVGDTTNNYQRQLNFVDNLSWIKGAHQFKFGIDYRQLFTRYGQNSSLASFFTSESAIANATASFAFVSNVIKSYPRFTNFSAYGQDTWKVNPRLQLDLGLRWELNPAPTEANGNIPPVVLGITGNPPDLSKAALAPPGTPLYKTFYTAFAPRIGAAYQLRQKAGYETVLRGGFGVYYDLGSGGATNGFPLFSSTTLSNVPFPIPPSLIVPAPVTIPTSLPVTTVVFSNADSLKLPYTLQWNLGVEQSLGSHQVVSLSYVAASARRLLTTQQLNYPLDNFCCGAPSPNPNFFIIAFTWNGPTSDYDSMQAQYKARFSHGIQALVNYTWSHAIDDVSSDLGQTVLTRGNANFDIRHNLSAAVSYNLPSLKTVPILKQLLANWTLDGIVHAQSGMPVNVTGPSTIIAGTFFAVRPDMVAGQPLYIKDPAVVGGRKFNAAAFKNPPVNPQFPNLFQQGNFGRNVLRGLPLYQLDIAIGRNFKVTESARLQLKAEAFNVFNHPNFGCYGASYLSAGNFGVPGCTLHNNLGGLSSLYQIGGPRSIQLSARISL